MTTRDTAIRNLCESLGKDYTLEVIDYEPVVYRDFGNGFNVEISGAYTTSKKRPVNIYLWCGDKIGHCKVVRDAQEVSRANITEVVESFLDYSNELIASGVAASKYAQYFNY